MRLFNNCAATKVYFQHVVIPSICSIAFHFRDCARGTKPSIPSSCPSFHLLFCNISAHGCFCLVCHCHNLTFFNINLKMLVNTSVTLPVNLLRRHTSSNYHMNERVWLMWCMSPNERYICLKLCMICENDIVKRET